MQLVFRDSQWNCIRTYLLGGCILWLDWTSCDKNTPPQEQPVVEMAAPSAQIQATMPRYSNATDFSCHGLKLLIQKMADAAQEISECNQAPFNIWLVSRKAEAVGRINMRRVRSSLLSFLLIHPSSIAYTVPNITAKHQRHHQSHSFATIILSYTYQNLVPISMKRSSETAFDTTSSPQQHKVQKTEASSSRLQAVISHELVPVHVVYTSCTWPREPYKPPKCTQPFEPTPSVSAFSESQSKISQTKSSDKTYPREHPTDPPITERATNDTETRPRCIVRHDLTTVSPHFIRSPRRLISQYARFPDEVGIYSATPLAPRMLTIRELTAQGAATPFGVLVEQRPDTPELPLMTEERREWAELMNNIRLHLVLRI